MYKYITILSNFSRADIIRDPFYDHLNVILLFCRKNGHHNIHVATVPYIINMEEVVYITIKVKVPLVFRPSYDSMLSS